MSKRLRWTRHAGAGADHFLIVAAAAIPLTMGMDYRLTPIVASRFVANAGLALAATACALMMLRVMRDPALPPELRRTWRLLAIGAVLNAIAEINWLVFESLLGAGDDFWLNIPYFLAYLPLTAGLLALPPGIKSKTELAKFWLDTATVVLAGTMGVYYFVMFPAVTAYDATLADRILAVAYPVFDLVMLLGVVTVALRRVPRAIRSVLVLLVAGMLLQLGGDLLFSWITVSSGYETGTLPDLIWALAYVLMLLGAYRQRVSLHAGAFQLDLDGGSARARSALPFLAVTGAYVHMSWVTFTRPHDALTGLVLCGVLVTGVVIARQVIEMRENARLAAAQQAARSEKRFRSLVQNSSDAVLIVAPDGRLLYLSPAAERVFGSGDGNVRTLLDVADERHRPEIARALAELSAGGSTAAMEWRTAAGPAGRQSILHSTFTNLLGDPDVGAIVVNSHDVTERVALEAQFHQAQKLEAIGRLAGGVAHDFNNLLTAIQGNTHLLLDGRDGTGSQELQEIVQATEMAAGLTRQLLTFSRKHVGESRVIDLGELVQRVHRMLRRLIGDDVILDLHIAPSVWTQADPNRLEQIILNLVVNARDALESGGVIRVTTEVAELDATTAAAFDRAARPGRWAILTVADNGCGMDAETLACIFEPFFTTKSERSGTGLGLSTVYAIATQLGGWIGVDSTPRQGTTFRIALPAAAAPQDVEEHTPAPEQTESPRTRCVLLVEDEDSVRMFAQKVLVRAGYRVHAAANGCEAIAIAADHMAGIDVVLTDVSMPGMGGAETARALQLQRPGLPVVFMSGYSDDDIMWSEVRQSSAGFLQKPFTPQQLLHVLQSVSAGH